MNPISTDMKADQLLLGRCPSIEVTITTFLDQVTRPDYRHGATDPSDSLGSQRRRL
jgi:hypothetical protein